MYEEYFKRQIQLWGIEAQRGLESKRVAIIGCGGLGCSLALALGASGIGTIHLVDFDSVSVHNIHRQVGFTEANEGRPKATVLGDLVSARCSYTKAHAHVMDLDGFMALEIEVDLILDATDNLPSREKIDNYARKRQTPWVYASVEEWRGQVCFFDKATFSVFKVTDRKPGGIAAPIVMHIASLEANLALRYLVGLPVVRDRLYYLYFNDDGELITQKFDLL